VSELLRSYCLPGPAKLGQRIAVIGSACVGKTTLAKFLAEVLEIKHIELDALHWGPDWQPLPDLELHQKVQQAISLQSWITDGNYSKLRDIIWPRVDTFVWLDYALVIVLWRWFKRTSHRVFTKERLWNNNRETFRDAFLSGESLLFWILKRHQHHRREYTQLLKSPAYSEVTRIYLPNPQVTAKFCAAVETMTTLNHKSKH
jgi:adenylate kinase family enzyme